MTLRDRIREIISNDEQDRFMGSDADYRAPSRGDTTDRILAAVREAMLSDEVIEAARRGFVIGPTGAAWTGSMTAALTAAGIAESEVENDTE